MRPRKLLRIARWEVTKNADSLGQRKFAALAALLAVFSVAVPLVGLGDVGLDNDLYRVGVEETSPYHDVVSSDDQFVAVESADTESLARGSVDLLVLDNGTVQRTSTQKGEAAYDEFRSTVRAYNDRQLREERNQTAAFPVEVVLDFQQRQAIRDALEQQRILEQTGTNDSADSQGNASNDTLNDTVDDVDDDTDDGVFGQFGAPLVGDELSGPPSQIDPPFPFQSLILALLFVVPLNFLVQAYGSTMLADRLNRRGELLLASPVSRLDIIGGKTLPYFLGAMLVETVLVVLLFLAVQGGLGGLFSVFAILPLVMLFLSTTFLGAMFARSFTELTFVTLAITVLLTTYAFVPAIFAEVSDIALVSPLTLVIRNLQSQPVGLSEFLFTTIPPMLVSVVCFSLGTGLYREEDMFAQRSLSGRLIDSLAGPVVKRWHVGMMTALLLPVVLVVQLFAIALLLLPSGVSTGALVVVLFGVVAVTEEVAKSLHIYAAYDHSRFDRLPRTAVVLGALSGIGFFVGENIVVAAQFAGLPDVSVGEAGVLGGAAAGAALPVLLLAPLVLHVVTASISALGASRSRRWYVVAVSLAILLHFGYNLAVVMFVA